MDLTRVEWWGGVSYGRSLTEVRVGDLGLKWGSSSSTCSSSTWSFEGDLGEHKKYLVIG